MNRIKELISCIPFERFSVLIKTGPNLFYLTGFEGEGYLYIDPEEVVLFTDGRYLEDAEKIFKGKIELLERRSMDFILSCYKGGPIFVEYERMSCREFMELQRLPLSGNISNIDWALSKMRSRKSKDEVEKIKKAIDLAERTLFYVLDNYLREGVSELELASEFVYHVRREGGGLSFEPIVLFGENTSKPHGIPSTRRLKKGDVVLIDFGARVNGYCSDETITFCYGKASEEFLRLHSIVLEAKERVENSIDKGATPKDAYTSVRSFFASKGVDKLFLHSLGHGVGVEVHEAPNLSKNSKDCFTTNSVFTVEPGLYIKGRFGVRIEDMLVYQESGAEKLTKMPKSSTFDELMKKLVSGG